MFQQPSNFVPPGRLKEIEGDISVPTAAGNRIILLPVSSDTASTDGGTVFKRWDAASNEYKRWYNVSYGKLDQFMGQIKTAQVQSDTMVAFLLCKNGKKIDYTALEKCLDAVGRESANYSSSTIHVSKFGTWKKVESLLDAQLLKRGLNVNVYI